MKTIHRTFNGIRLQSLAQLGLPYTQIPKSTLNEKFGVFPNVMPDNPVVDYPTLSYIAIGNRGHRYMTGADGVGLTPDHVRSPEDAALFNHLPFVMRAPSDDLSAVERQRYGMRVEMDHNGATWIAYYLRALDKSNLSVIMERRRVSNGITRTEPFVPDSANLSPEPMVVPNGGAVVTSGDKIVATATLPIVFTPQDVLEFMNVIEILYGDPQYAKISELAIVAACQKQVTVQTPGGTPLNYIEAVQAMVTSFVSADYNLHHSNRGFTIDLGVGSSEPLMTVSTGY